MNAPDSTPYTRGASRNLLSGGLGITLRAFPAVLWTYLLSLGIALLFSARFFGQWNALLSHSLVSQSLVSSFDFGTVASGFLRLSERVPGGNSPSLGGVLLFGLMYFLLVPGALFCYATAAPARLSTLLSSGVAHFWRFVRITLLTLVAAGLILGALGALNSAIASRIDEHIVGRPAFVLERLGDVILFLCASLLRLYFDMVEVYTVQLGLRTLPGGRTDRRVRRALRPAWHALTRHLASNWLTFLLLTALGLAVLALSARYTVVTLAQPRVWPAFLLAQIAILLDLFTRFWQRGAETVYAANHPIALAPQSVPPVVPMADRLDPLPTTHVVPPPPSTEAPAF